MKEQVKTAQTGLEALNAKLDDVLSAAAKSEENAKSAMDKVAELEAQITAQKNMQDISFTPAGKKADEKELNTQIKTFLNDVKAARFGASKAALQSGATPGSYLVPEGFVPTVIDLLAKQPSFISRTRILPWGLDGNTRQIPNLSTRPTITKVAEGAAKPVSNPVFSQLTQVLVKAAAIVVLTKELAEDSAIDLAALLPDLIAPALVEYYNDWIFKGNGDDNPGILTASGVLSPTVASISDLLALKLAVPAQIREKGSFFIDTALYGELAALARNSAPAWLYYEEGKMRIDGSAVEAVETSLIGARKAVFGDLGTIIFSPRTDMAVRYSDTATVVESSTVTHNLYQENKEAYLFETRAALNVVGSVWAKATVPAATAE